MPQLDLLTDQPAFLAPHPMAALCVSGPLWWRVPLDSRWPSRGKQGLRSLQTILHWMLEQGGRLRVELRLAGSGAHSGAWLGVAGVGATTRDAEACGRRAKKQLSDALQTVGIEAMKDRAPALPGPARGLVRVGRGARLQSDTGLEATREALPSCSIKGHPLLVRVQFDLSRAHGELIREAQRTCQSAASSDRPEPGWLMSRTGQLVRVEGPGRRAMRVLDEAAALRMRVLVQGRRLPGALRLRILSDAMQADLGGHLAWSAEAEPLSCGVSVLGDALRLMANRGRIFEGDEIPF